MNTPKQTFSPVLTALPARDKINAEQRWLRCPVCGKAKVLKLLPETSVQNLPVYCKRCGAESIVNIPFEPEP